MEHTPEFTHPAGRARELPQAVRELAGAYARVFAGTPDGKRVLADLSAKFNPADGAYGLSATAVTPERITGWLDVLHEINKAVKIGSPSPSQIP